MCALPLFKTQGFPGCFRRSAAQTADWFRSLETVDSDYTMQSSLVPLPLLAQQAWDCRLPEQVATTLLIVRHKGLAEWLPFPIWQQIINALYISSWVRDGLLLS